MSWSQLHSAFGQMSAWVRRMPIFAPGLALRRRRLRILEERDARAERALMEAASTEQFSAELEALRSAYREELAVWDDALRAERLAEEALIPRSRLPGKRGRSCLECGVNMYGGIHDICTCCCLRLWPDQWREAPEDADLGPLVTHVVNVIPDPEALRQYHALSA